jgi:hypothetical protein
MINKKNLIIIIIIIGIAILTFSIYFFSIRKISKEELEWKQTIQLLENSKKLEIEHYVTGEEAFINKSNFLFNDIINFIKSSTIRRITSKKITIGNITTYVTIPYPYGYFLTFELKDENKIKFNLVGNILWFETESAIYEIEVNSNIENIIEGILFKESTSVIKHEAYNEGLKLIVSLSSNKIKKGDVLTINATLLNINNTENITFAASYGGIKINIFDKYGNMFYGIAMIAPGPTAPFPIFKQGEKINHVLKWDTSENILNGSIPPSIGKYYLEIEAHVTNLETKSKIILRIEKIEIELFN